MAASLKIEKSRQAAFFWAVADQLKFDMSTPASLTSLDPSVIKSESDESNFSDANDVDIVLPAEDTASKIASTDQVVEQNEGLKLWLARRKTWTEPTTKGRKSTFVLPEEYQSLASMYTIYDALIHHRRRLSKPLPLRTTVRS